MNLKSPQPPEPEDKKPVSRWVLKIQELEQRIVALEIYIRDLELDCAQARMALVNLTTSMVKMQGEVTKGLTSNPWPFDKEQQQVWEQANKAPY